MWGPTPGIFLNATIEKMSALDVCSALPQGPKRILPFLDFKQCKNNCHQNWRIENFQFHWHLFTEIVHDSDDLAPCCTLINVLRYWTIAFVCVIPCRFTVRSVYYKWHISISTTEYWAETTAGKAMTPQMQTKTPPNAYYTWLRGLERCI
jgi:hypothetical protein